MISNSPHFEKVQELEEHFSQGIRALDNMRDPKKYLGFLGQTCTQLGLYDDWKSSGSNLEIDSHWISRPYGLFGFELFRLDLARVVCEPWSALRQHREVPYLVYHDFKYGKLAFEIVRKSAEEPIRELAKRMEAFLESDVIVRSVY